VAYCLQCASIVDHEAGPYLGYDGLRHPLPDANLSLRPDLSCEVGLTSRRGACERPFSSVPGRAIYPWRSGSRPTSLQAWRGIISAGVKHVYGRRAASPVLESTMLLDRGGREFVARPGALRGCGKSTRFLFDAAFWLSETGTYIGRKANPVERRAPIAASCSSISRCFRGSP